MPQDRKELRMGIREYEDRPKMTPSPDKEKEVEELAKTIKRIVCKVGFNHNPLAKLLIDLGYHRSTETEGEDK